MGDVGASGKKEAELGIGKKPGLHGSLSSRLLRDAPFGPSSSALWGVYAWDTTFLLLHLWPTLPLGNAPPPVCAPLPATMPAMAEEA